MSKKKGKSKKKGGVYTGSYKNGKKDGQGDYTFKSGNKYHGHWKNDKMHGFGIMFYANGGGTYEGNWEKGKMNGKGKLLWGDGSSYEGKFKRGMKHGEGTTTYPDGSSYSGKYKLGKKHGQGTIKKNDGHTIVGKFVEGVCEGVGIETLANGDRYSGVFKKGKYSGHGVFTYAKSGDKYEGKMHGKGKYTYKNGSVYEGDYKKGRKHGKGRLERSSGTTYTGEFKRGHIHGQGKMVYNNGRMYEGQFKKSKRSGEGKLFFRDGNRYEGEFKGNLMEGKGKYFFTGGSYYEGGYKGGKKHGSGQYLKVKNGKKELYSVEYSKGKCTHKEKVKEPEKAEIEKVKSESESDSDEEEEFVDVNVAELRISDSDSDDDGDSDGEEEKDDTRRYDSPALVRQAQMANYEIFDSDEEIEDVDVAISVDGADQDGEQKQKVLIGEVRVKCGPAIKSLFGIPLEISTGELVGKLIKLFELQPTEVEAYYVKMSNGAQLTVSVGEEEDGDGDGGHHSLEEWVVQTQAETDVVKCILKDVPGMKEKLLAKKNVVRKEKHVEKGAEEEDESSDEEESEGEEEEDSSDEEYETVMREKVKEEPPEPELSDEKEAEDGSEFEISEKNIVLSSTSLGKGAQGNVIKGVYKVGFAKVKIAIKQIDLGDEDYDEEGLDSIENVKREIKILCEIDHENIIQCFGFFRVGEVISVVLEYAPLGDLYTYKKKLKTKKVRINVLLGIAKGMAHLHGKEIVHRDLKTGNILMFHTENGPQGKICDFGASKQVQSINDTLVGTPQYIAPEQFLPREVFGKDFDPKLLDVYSFGLIMWEVSTSRMPYQKEYVKLKKQAMSLLKLIHTTSLRPDVAQMRGYPEDFVQLVEDCWQVLPTDRPDSFDAIVECLELVQNQMK